MTTPNGIDARRKATPGLVLPLLADEMRVWRSLVLVALIAASAASVCFVDWRIFLPPSNDIHRLVGKSLCLADSGFVFIKTFAPDGRYFQFEDDYNRCGRWRIVGNTMCTQIVEPNFSCSVPVAEDASENEHRSIYGVCFRAFTEGRNALLIDLHDKTITRYFLKSFGLCPS